MPELPEVEMVRRGLIQEICPATIIGVDIYWQKIITPPFSSEKFGKSLVNETIHTIERRGKYLIFLMDQWAMISHLRMEGKYRVCLSKDPLEKHTHVIFHLADGRDLRYLDVRKFGRMTLVPIKKIKETVKLLGLGPEPCLTCFDVDIFYQQLQKITRMIKPVLLDQKLVAGIGNIYADEILFRAHIHPTRSCMSLSYQEVTGLHSQIIQVMDEAIRAGGSTIRTYVNSFGMPGTFQQQHAVYGREGEPCPVCGSTIQKIRVGQRGTHYCPRCQK